MVCRITTLSLLLLLLLQVLVAARIVVVDAAQPGPVVGTCIEKEMEALLKFKESLIDHSGWLSSWMAGEDCCNWEGVSCSNRTGNVVGLNLKASSTCGLFDASDTTFYDRKCLFGKLNPSLINLTYLNYLDLSNNNFQGNPFPGFVASLNSLRYLDLSYASFSGMIPPHLGNLSNLIHLDLTSNPLSLRVSDVAWLSNLQSLEYLGLGGVNLSKVSDNMLKEVNKLPSLLELRLPGTELKDLPQSLPVTNITSLLFLDLSSNLFSSPLPRWIFNISTLVSLQLDGCNLTGNISEISWESLCDLRTLDLSINLLSGQIKEFVDSLSGCRNDSLEEIDFSSNKLTGGLPDSLGLLSSLRSLRLKHNSFSGQIPESIGNLSGLLVFDLSFNIMSGIIPQSIGQLDKLYYLGLCGNLWEGTITETCFQNLTSLDEFSLSSASDSLVFNVRPDWIPPFNLSVMSMDNFQVGPNFPSWLKTQNRISQVSLSNTALSGTIPDWLWTLSPWLWWLDLSDNMLQGRLPDSIRVSNTGAWIDLGFNRLEGPLPLWPNVTNLSLRNNLLSGPIPSNLGETVPTLENLDLSNNFFNGKIPRTMSKMRNLSFLDLSSNYLSGKIPSNFQDLQRLMVLDLSKNNLVGNIPNSICLLPSLLWLTLSSNKLTGKLSSTLRNCAGLYSVDLGYNRLTGTISEWIEDNFLTYTYVGLRANMLSGKIPEQICYSPYLHILDLAHNNLSGFIPKCLGNKSVWKSSRIDYHIPTPDTKHIEFSQRVELVVKGRRNEYTKIISLVNILDLSHNKLSGEIPEEITYLTSLGTLNLSWNQFTGNIPESIGRMRWLESLDLSFNHLNGPIPPSMTSLTSLGYLNLSYNNLSGQIPSANQFLTFNDPSIYEGNSKLCGLPLPTKCFTDTIGLPDDKDGSEDEDHGDDTVWFYACIGLGFIFGFWVVCGTLAINKSCRTAYFKFVDRMNERISLVVSPIVVQFRWKTSF